MSYVRGTIRDTMAIIEIYSARPEQSGDDAAGASRVSTVSSSGASTRR